VQQRSSSLLYLARPHDGFIQELKQRMKSAEGFQNDAAELWRCHNVGWQESRCQELLAPQEVGTWMIGRESPGDSQQLFAGEAIEQPSEWASIQNGFKAFVVKGNMAANSRQILGLRAVQPSPDQEFLRCNVQVEACPLILCQSPVGEAGGHVSLVRRFIFRKSRVPIDTIEADFGSCLDLGGKCGEFGGQGVDDFNHRLANIVFVSLFVL